MGNPDLTSKLEAAETKLHELKSNVATLGKEASADCCRSSTTTINTTAPHHNEVESERCYHYRVLQILDQLESEMVSERQRIEAPTSPVADHSMPPPPSYDEVNGVSASAYEGVTDSMGYSLGEVMHSYQAESDVELNLSVGDYIVVRKVSNNGWAEGECKGKAGWFPFGFVERRDRVLASKIAEVV
ncbi:SH3 domain-containing protein 2-like [Papaver somniferum]|nr:SH3 domain-containing protein 2-like [Papaver somniferum]